MKISRSLTVALVFCASAVAADGTHGKIKICRVAVPGAATGAVYLPADGTYTAACDGADGCRKFVIGVTAASTLKAGAGACATLDAVLTQSDGQAITAGQTLIAQWDTGSLAAHVTVVEGFH